MLRLLYEVQKRGSATDFELTVRMKHWNERGQNYEAKMNVSELHRPNIVVYLKTIMCYHSLHYVRTTLQGVLNESLVFTCSTFRLWGTSRTKYIFASQHVHDMLRFARPNVPQRDGGEGLPCDGCKTVLAVFG